MSLKHLKPRDTFFSSGICNSLILDSFINQMIVLRKNDIFA